MSKHIIRVEVSGYREYEVEAENKEQARDNYLENLDNVKMVDEDLSEEGYISQITKKSEHLHYSNK